MRYRITGIEHASKKAVDLVIDAADEPAARAEAAKRKVTVERIEPLPDAARSATPQEPPSPAVGIPATTAKSEPILVRIEPGHVQLIERTAKRWKALLLVSLIILTFGVILGGYFLLRDPRSLAHPPALAWIGGMLALIGLLGVIVARLGAWWHHG